MYLQNLITKSTRTYLEDIKLLKEKFEEAEFIVLGAGAGLSIDKDKIKMRIPTELIPICPDDNKYMTLNLRIDNSFVEDEGWRNASYRYNEFLESSKNKKVLFLELGVGMNTPGIIKYPFWHMVSINKNATYACINYKEAFAPKELEEKSIILNEDINKVISVLV